MARNETNMPRQIIRDFGTSLFFTGTGTYVTVPHNAALSATTALTLSAWVWNHQGNDSQYRRIIDKGSGDTVYELTTMNSSGKPKLRMRIWIGSSEKSAISNISIAQNKWVHVVGRYDGSKVNIFVDGVKQSNETSTSGNIDTSSSDLYVGSSVGAGSVNEMWKGYIDDVRVYANTGLTDDECTNLFYGIDPSVNPSLHLKFDEGSGSSAVDSSGNGLTGSITGATYSTNVKFKPRTIVS